ncbi:SRPBCC family protein [Hyphomonadaceae bacterium ML37]|nr:SRPBCC family protein [Hyphomonadaceae bacterium ML37]
MDDSIIKQIHLAAPPERVWRALSDAAEFGQWFRAEVTGEMREGATVRCRGLYPGTEHMHWDMRIITMEPLRRLVWEWPAFYPADFPDDPESDAMLTVEIALAPSGAGTQLTLTESGFAGLPGDHRMTAWRRNEDGWGVQMTNIADHVAR